MTIQASIAYARRETPTRSQRTIEYDLLARVTQRLRSAWAGRNTDYPALVQALSENRQLWSRLASDVALPGNSLPAELRARLFYLYEFTEHHSRAVMENRAGVEVLTDINTAVMRGLRGERGPG